MELTVKITADQLFDLIEENAETLSQVEKKKIIETLCKSRAVSDNARLVAAVTDLIYSN